MPLSDFAKDKIRSLHLSKKTTATPNGAFPPPPPTMTSPTQLRDLSSLPNMPITPRTADPLISSFPRSRSPSPTRQPNSGPDTKSSSITTTTAHSIHSHPSSTHKTPSFSETALTITTHPHAAHGSSADSPPLTSTLFSRHSASSATEEAWLAHSRRLRFARLVLSFLIFGCAVGALGCAGASYRAYRQTVLGEGWHLRLWPVDLDLRPCLAVVGSAAILSLVGLVVMVVLVVPSPRSNTTLHGHLFTLLTALALVLSLISVMLTFILQNNVNNTADANYRDTIQTFTCRFYRRAEEFNDEMDNLSIPAPLGVGVGYPAGFRGICRESEAGVGLMCAVLGLGIVSAGVVAWGVVVGRRVNRERMGRWAGRDRKGEM